MKITVEGEPTYILTLTKRELEVLAAASYHIDGPPDGPRGFFDAIGRYVDQDLNWDRGELSDKYLRKDTGFEYVNDWPRQ